MRHRRGGFMFVDAMIGMGLIAVVAGMLAIALNHQQRAMNQFANSRDAVRLAQAALERLQTDVRTNAIRRPDPRVKVERVVDEAPAGKTWVRVTATIDGRSENLVGLAPEENAR